MMKYAFLALIAMLFIFQEAASSGKPSNSTNSSGRPSNSSVNNTGFIKPDNSSYRFNASNPFNGFQFHKPGQAPKPGSREAQLEKHAKIRIQAMLKRLPSEVLEKLTDANFTQNLTLSELAKVPVEVFRILKPEVIQNLPTSMIKSIANKLFRGQSAVLAHFLKLTTKEVFLNMIQQTSILFTASKKSIPKDYSAAIIAAAKVHYGNANKWNLDLLRKLRLPQFFNGFSPQDFAKIPTLVWKTILSSPDHSKVVGEMLRNADKGQQIAIIQAAVRAFGKPNTWTISQSSQFKFRSYILLPYMDVKYLKLLSNSYVAAFVKTYFKTPGVAATLPREAGNIIISKLSKVWGNPKTWNKTLINQIGVLRKVLPLSALKNLPANTLRDTFTDLGKQSLKAAQRAALGKRAIEVYGNPKNWTAADLSNIGSIAKSVGRSSLLQLNRSVVLDSISSLSTVNFDRQNGRIMLNHIKQATSDTWGKVKSWTSSHVKQLGSLVTGLSTSDFDQLSKSTIQDSLSTLKTHVKSLRKVARRKIIKKLGSDFRTMLANISDFVQDIPFRNLTDITFGNLDATGDSQPNWSKGQALKLINLYLDEYGDIGNTSSSNYGFENIRKMGSLVTGMTHANLSQLPFDGCIDTLTVLTARTDWSIGQIKVLYRMFKACMAITSAQNFSSITTDDLTAAGQVLSFLTPEEIGNMTNATCREAIRTIGSSGNFDGSHILAYQRRLDAALRCYEKNNNKNFTDDDILSFGKLVCGMQVAHIKRIPNDVLSNHLYSICRLRCLSSTLKKEIANRTKMAVGYPVNMANPMQALPSETVRDLGPCLDGFTSAELNKLNPETIRFSADSFNGEKFLAATKAVIVAKYFETYNVTRRRRATSTVTSYDILSLGSDLSTGLTVNDINNMDNATFADSVETLGNASLSKDQIYALAARAKQYWGSLDHFGPDTISALGIIMTGFNSSDIAKLNLTDSDAISALGEQSWDSSQLTELIARIKNNYAGSDVATWTADHFLAVKNMIAGLSTSDLSKIDQQAYENAADTIGVVPGMSLAQLQQLCSKAKGSFGSTVSTWETASVRTAGVALGGCDSADLSSLSNDAINAMKANAIKNFPGSQLAKFTSAQIGQFDESQASAITATQKSSLSSAQVQALNQAQQGDNYVSDSSTSAPSATTAPALATTKTSAATAIRAGLSLVASIVIAITML